MDQGELRERLESLVADAGLILVDLSVGRIGRRVAVRLLVDRVGRVSVNECAALSRTVMDFLDSGDPLGIGNDDYRLEVGSPGVGRPLESEADWRRTAGRTLRIETDEGAFIGILEGSEGGTLRFADGRVVETDSIRRAVEVLEEPPRRDP